MTTWMYSSESVGLKTPGLESLPSAVRSGVHLQRHLRGGGCQYQDLNLSVEGVLVAIRGRDTGEYRMGVVELRAAESP